MRTNVTFRHPAEFVPVSEDDGILSVDGAGWFVSLLKRVSALIIDPRLCQEDWGVVVFVERDGMRFWIGLSSSDEGDWLAHVHHGPRSFLQRFRKSGRIALERLVADLHGALAGDPSIRNVTWYHERDMNEAAPRGARTPMDP
jgi:hypothetical protein